MENQRGKPENTDMLVAKIRRFALIIINSDDPDRVHFMAAEEFGYWTKEKEIT